MKHDQAENMGAASLVFSERLRSGSGIFAILMALYYSTVVLVGLHFTVIQVIVLWGLCLLILPGYRAALSRAEVGLILSIIAIFGAALLSYAANDLWNQPGANLSRYARFLLFVPVYMVARRFATPEGFWGGMLVGAWCTGVWSVLEFLDLVRHPSDRWPMVNGGVNPIQFGDLSLLLAMIVTAGLPIYARWGRRFLVVAALSAGLSLFGSIFSITRGAWIAIPAILAILLWCLIRWRFLNFRTVLVAGLVALATMVVVVPRSDILPGAMEAIDDFRSYQPGDTKNSSVGYRFEMWRASWEIFTSRPWLGVGPGRYYAHVRKLGQQDTSYNPVALEHSHPHSEYFFQLVTLGILGTFALMLLFVIPLLRYVRAMLSAQNDRRMLGLAGTIMIVGYLHFGLTEALLFQHATFLGFYLLTVAVLSALIDRQNPDGLMEKEA